MVADNLPNEQVDGIREIFHMMDTDKNGSLSFDELKDGLHKIGHPVADPDVKMLIEAVSVFCWFFHTVSSCCHCCLTLFPGVQTGGYGWNWNAELRRVCNDLCSPEKDQQR